MTLYHVYTDGACSGNPGPGGWAAVVLDDRGNLLVELSGFEPSTTNNRMEIQGAISGIQYVLDLVSEPEILLYSDSSYLVQAYTKGWMEKWLKTGWKKGTVKNQDLWLKLNQLLKQSKVTWLKVKGHADNKYNNRCDQLAVGQIKQNSAQESPLRADKVLPGDTPPKESVFGKKITPERVLLPSFDPVTLNNRTSKKPSENRCLVAKADLAANVKKIEQVFNSSDYGELKKKLAPQTIGSINSCVAYATFNHPVKKVHPFFLQVGEMTDFWLARNLERDKPYPAPSRSDIVRFMCSFIINSGLDKARELGLEK